MLGGRVVPGQNDSAGIASAAKQPRGWTLSAMEPTPGLWVAASLCSSRCRSCSHREDDTGEDVLRDRLAQGSEGAADLVAEAAGFVCGGCEAGAAGAGAEHGDELVQL